MNKGDRVRALSQRLLKVLAALLVSPAVALWVGVQELLASAGDLLGWESKRRQEAAALLDDRRAEWRDDLAPSAVLRAEYGIVPFHGRDAEVEDLDRWCAGDRPLALRLYTAPGGYGKTRLFREQVARQRRAKWQAGFLREGDDSRSLDPILGGYVRPVFVVVDYAESRRAETRSLLRAALASRQKRVRVVLLARSGDDWWRELRQEGERIGDFLQGPAVEGPIPLKAPFGSREAAFRRAAEAFAAHGGRPILERVPPLDDERFESFLLVHVTALASVEGSPEVPAQRLLDWLENRELDGMCRAGAAAGLPPTLPPAVVQAAALLTLAGGAEREATLEIVARTPLLVGQPADMRQAIAGLLHRLYPGRKWCEGVQPDLLGEHVVARQATADAALFDAAFGQDVPEALRRAGLTVLARLARRDEAAAELLDRALGGHFERLALPAVEVAQEVGDPIGLRLAAALETKSDADLELAIESLVPETTTALREVAAIVTGRRGERLRRQGGDPEVLAACLNNLSNRLAALGRREEALSAIEASVEIRRRLAAARPDVFEPGVARSLNNLSSHLADLDRREEALAAIEGAVEIYRSLAASRPEAFEPALATSLNNLSRSLADLGRREEALSVIERAEEIYRPLAAARPKALEPHLATILNTLSLRLSALSRREEALSAIERSVEIRRRLTAVRPEAFEPELAASLSNLSNCLGVLGRPEEALSAIEGSVEIRRRLAAARPEIFEPDLATSLNNLSDRLSALGRREEALSAIEASEEIYRRLAAARPNAFEADLASSLNNLSLGLAAVGRPEEALSAIERSVEIRRRLAAARPEAFEPDLARSLGFLSSLLLDLERPGLARAAVEEGLGRLAPWYERYPASFADLARREVLDYLRAVAACGEAPDPELLRRFSPPGNEAAPPVVRE